MLRATLLGLLALAASTSAQTAKYCPGGTDVCFSESKIAASDLTFRIAIPETQAAPFDILLQIVAPVTVGWASIAWGGKMTQNPLTIGWANGNSAVVSSRWANSRTAPTAYAGATYKVLPSTTANATHWQLDVLCTGCSQWANGKLDPNGAASFAWAKNTKAPTNPALNTSTIQYHDSHGTFSHDLSVAKIPQGVFDALAYATGGGAAPASSSAAVAAPTSSSGGILTSVVTLPVSSSPVFVSLTTSNALPIVSLTTTNGLPIVSLTTTNGLPIVTLTTASFPLALPSDPVTRTDNLPSGDVVIATRPPVRATPDAPLSRTATRVRASSTARAPSFSLIVPSSTTLRVITTRVTTRPGPSTTLVFPKTTSTRRVANPTPVVPVVTVTVTRAPPTVEVPQPTIVRGPPWGGPRRGGPPGRGRPGRRPWGEEDDSEGY